MSEELKDGGLVADTSFPGAYRQSFTLKPVMGYQICWATHPMQKNFDRNSRGRALHYRVHTQKLTLCNMRFAGAAEKHTKENGACSGRVCKVCVQKLSERLQNRNEKGGE